MEESKDIHIGFTLVGVLVAIAVFASVWIVGGTLFGLWDNLRGLRDDKFQALFRELVVPGLGGYAAMVVVGFWLQKANTRFVFFGFATVVLILVGVYVGFVGPLAKEIGTDMWGVFLDAVSLSAAVVGAYIHVKDDI